MPTLIESINELNQPGVLQPRKPVFPSPADWRDQFIYFLLVDRFDDGRQDDIPMYDPQTAPRGQDSNQGGQFQGGTITGITRRLDYIKNLGCAAIWISPVLKNRSEKSDSYHGYGIQNFLEIDPRFGTLEDFQELIQEAHSRGMYVIMDVVINHTGDNWAYPGDYPYYFWPSAPGPFDLGFWREYDSAPGFQKDDAAWPKEFQQKDFYKRRGQITNWYDHNQAVNGDFLSLKELDTTRSDVLNTVITVYKYWIANTDIDGFRIDTVKHLEDSFTALFCNGIREYAKTIGKHNFFIFGEIVDDDWTIQKYLGRNSRIEGTNERFPSLDAALDFPLYFILEDVIKGFKRPVELRERYERFKTMYSDHGDAGRYFVTFFDNHDRERRFLHNNQYTKQAILAAGYLLTSQGVPCIYYGTEQAFDGGGNNDKYVRECMFGGNWGAFNTTGVHFFNENHPIYQDIKVIAKIRSNEPALKYGRQYFRDISGDGNLFGFPTVSQCTLAFSRILDTTEILVAINLENSPRQDYIAVDRNLTSPGSRVLDLVTERLSANVEEIDGRACVKVPLQGHQIAILKLFH